MGNYAQGPAFGQSQQQAPPNPFLAALFNAALPQLQQMQQTQTTQPFNLGQPQGPFGNGPMNGPMGGQNAAPANPWAHMQTDWNPGQDQLSMYRNLLNDPSLKGTPNASEVAAHMALFGPGYGGLRDYNTDQGRQVFKLMQMGNMPAPGGQPAEGPMGAGMQTDVGSFDPRQQGIAQMNPAKTVLNMPNPTQRILGGVAGMNPWIPKKNPWGAL